MNNPWTDTPTIERPEWLTDELEHELKKRELPFTHDGMLVLHSETKKLLDFYKEKEMEYRKVTAKLLVPDTKNNEGMNNVELGNGYVAKVGIKLNYKLDGSNDKVWQALDKIGKIGNQGKFIAERLVSWSPSFLKTEYTALQEEAAGGSVEATAMLKIIHEELITITEAAPTLEVREPKAKK